jgi:hypothetical protein
MPLLEQYKSLFDQKPYMVNILTFIYTDILEFHKKAVRMFRGKSTFQSAGSYSINIR